MSNCIKLITNTLFKVFHIKRRLFIQKETTASQNISICFAITVFDEYEELRNILNGIIPYIKPSDEILIQGDEGKVTDNVLKVIQEYNQYITKYIEYPLNNNFGEYKSNLSKNTNCSYIFQLDADEIPSPFVMEHIHTFLSNNPYDLIRIARINIMIENEEPFILWESFDRNKQYQTIDFPNYQKRIYKNSPDIFWINKLHEKIIGFKTVCFLPSTPDFCLLHCKHWKKQDSREVIFGKCKE